MEPSYSYLSHFVAMTEVCPYDSDLLMHPSHKIVAILGHGEPVLSTDGGFTSILQDPWAASLRRYIDYGWPEATKFSFLGWDQIGWDNPQSEKRALA